MDPFTWQAFFTEVGPRLFIAGIIHEGDRLLARPNLEALYEPVDASVEDVVIAALDTTFGEGTPPDTRLRPVDFGPWR